jgi:hypothetical protein
VPTMKQPAIRGFDMGKLIPCRELPLGLPKKRQKKPAAGHYEDHEMFGFDTETTRCGKKELRSYQAVWQDDSGRLYGLLIYLDGWYVTERLRYLDDRLRRELGSVNYMGTVVKMCSSVNELKRCVQQAHEELIYDGLPRMVQKKRWQRAKRQAVRCAVAFNGNFDYGAMADATELHDNLKSGTMEGPGVVYCFRAGETIQEKAKTGLRIEAMFLGAASVPFTMKRGELWDISTCARNLWDARNLKQCGQHIGIDKLEPDFNCPVYAMMDAVVTLRSAQRLTADLLSMGFKGSPDRFISGATVAKDVMSQHYTPFYLNEEQHTKIWPAYFGGMTGPTKASYAHEQVNNVVYGDLDGAYNVSGQNLAVFDWAGVRELGIGEAEMIVELLKADPSRYWEFGSVHLRVKGDFDRCPMRVATVGENTNDTNPSTSSGLVWAKMRNYETTLCIGDFLHCNPVEGKHKILGGWMAVPELGRGPCIFKLAADERSQYESGTIGNQWWKLVGNSCYGVLANRNGKDRRMPGPFFNVLMASSITAAIRHCIWVINEAAGYTSYYNDTDSAMLTPAGFKAAQIALKPLKIGFSNKTDHEIKGCDIASVAVIHGSKRYAMVGPDGTFGAKCHGLGSWWAYVDGRVRSVAHHPPLLKAVWATAYPETFGEPDPKYAGVPLFHKFSVRTKRMSILVKRYAQRRYNLKLKELGPYGRAGNFGFVVPQIVDGKIVPYVAYEPEEAADTSDLTLEDVAMLWSGSWDKKFDYQNMKRWMWKGSDVRDVEPIAHTQNLLAEQQNTIDGDISVSEVAE